MGRVDLDYELFHLTPPQEVDTPPYSDAATEIGPNVQFENHCTATDIVFDADGDLVYGEEIPFETFAADQQLTSANGTSFAFHTQKAKFDNRSYANATLLYSGFPFSVQSRGRAVLKPTSHKKQDDAHWQGALDNEGLTGLLNCINAAYHDLWETSGSRLIARFYQPLALSDTVHSGRRPSNAQFRQALQEIDALSQQSATFRDIATLGLLIAQILKPVSITLWGVCKEYDRALHWLNSHDVTQSLLDQTEKRTLFKRNPLQLDRPIGTPPEVAPEVAALANEVLEASIHYVLSGTFRAGSYRGYVPSRKSPGTKHKQTVVTHLSHVYLDTMRSLQKRIIDSHKNKPRREQSRLSTPTETAQQPANSNVESDFRNSVDEILAHIRQSENNLPDVETTVDRAIRSGDTNALQRALAYAVALSQADELSQHDRIALLQRLLELKRSSISEIACVAQLASKALEPSV